MSVLCIQCAMEAMVAGEVYTPTDETAEAHTARVHPDLAACRARRRELEQMLAERIAAGVPIALGVNPPETGDDDAKE
jgi:hypothetical protein